MKLTIVKINPYHQVFGQLIPLLVPRLRESFGGLGDEENIALGHFMSQLWSPERDKTVLLLAAIDEGGALKGHVAAAKANNFEVLLTQPRLDEPAENDAVSEMLSKINDWAKSEGVSLLTLVSRRFDPKWAKKHGFEVARYILNKDVV